MTAWQVYWIMQADRFVNLFIGLGIAGAVAMLLAVAIYVPPEASTKEKYTKYIRRWVWAELGLLVFTVGMFAAAAFMPATKTLAAM